MTEKTILIEDCGDSFRVQYSYSDHWCNITAWEIVGIESSPVAGRVMFQRRGAPTSPDFVYTTDEAEKYLHGSIKWDGCSDLNFWPDDDGYVHWCGPHDFRKHFQLLETIYRRAQELMPQGNDDPWDEVKR